MRYELSGTSENGYWIFISTESDKWDDPDDFVALVKSIHQELGGEIINACDDDTIYKISNDIFDLRFQWDTLFGTVVILKKKRDKESVIKFLQKHIDELNSLSE